MKYIKTHENFIKNIFRKKFNLPNNVTELCDKITILFGEIFNEKLSYKFEKTHHYYDYPLEFNVYSINFKVDNILLFKVDYYDSFSEKMNKLKFDFEPEWITKQYEIFIDFLINLFADNLNDLYILNIDLSKLTRDEYEKFLINKDAKKYNL